MELRTQRAESRAEPDSNQETPPTWVGELDNMCSKRLQNCYGPNYSIASYYSIFEWGYLLELPCLCFDIVCIDIVWFSLQAEFRGNKQRPGLAGLEGKSDLWLKSCYTRETLSVWTRCSHKIMDFKPDVVIGWDFRGLGRKECILHMGGM